jgi:galacturonosyltransferase
MKEKGIDELLQAAEQVKSIYPEVQFDLIGFYEESYSDQINECARKHIINYYGKQEEVNTFLKRAHAILLPSYHEGMANVLLEGAATGRPVLASRIPGCREAYDEGISGLGFEVKNVESLVEAILRFIELPYEKRRAMGLSGRMKMEQEFDRSIVVNAYMEEIRQVTLS